MPYFLIPNLYVIADGIAVSVMMSNRRSFIRTVGGGAIIGLAGCAGAGQDGGDGNQTGTTDGTGTPKGNETDGNGDGGGGNGFPSEPLRYIVPYSPGGGVDVYAQAIGPQLGNQLGQDVQIEHISGASGLRGASEAYRADSAHTFAGLNPPAEVIASLVQEPGFDITEMTGIGAYATTAITIVGNPDLGIENYDDLVNRYDEGEFSAMGGLGIGSQQHICANVAKDQHGLNWNNYVPYDGSGPVQEAVISGEVPAGIGTDNAFANPVQSGDLDVVGIMTSAGSGVYPDVDPVTEYGYDNIDFIGQFTRILAGPPDVPDSHQSTLESALQEVMNSDEMQQWSEETGNPIMFEDGETAEELTQSAMEEIPEAVDLDELLG